MKDYYLILNVSSRATTPEIKSAYKKLAIKYHPDKNGGDKLYEEKFKLINEAYQTLSDVNKRYVYDNKLFAFKESEKREQFARQQQTSSVKPTFSTTDANYSYKYQTSFDFQEHINDYKQRNYVRPQKDNWNNYLIAFTFLFVAGTAFVLFSIYMNNYTANYHFEIAEKYYNSGNYHSALREYSEVLNFNEKHSNAYFKRAKTRYLIHQDYKLLESDINKAFSYCDTPTVEMYSYRAFTNYYTDDYKKAYQDLEFFITLRNDKSKIKTSSNYDCKLTQLSDDSLLFWTANTLVKLENYYKAKKVYLEAIKIQPICDYFIGSGYCNYKMNQYKEAINDFNSALLLDSNRPQIYYLRGLNYLSLDNKQKACLDFETAQKEGYNDATKTMLEFCK